MAHGTMAPVAQTITTGYTFSDKVNEKDLPFASVTSIKSTRIL